MKRLLQTTLVIITLFFNHISASAQADTSSLVKPDTTQAQIMPDNNDSVEDDEFNAGLLVFGSIFLATMAGAAIVGAAVTTALVALAALFIATGVVSVSIFVGLYNRSIKAGFKTLIVILCTLGGIGIGSIGLWLVTKIFHLHLSGHTALLTGALGGLGGGILLGFIVYKIIAYALQYVKKKLSLA